MTELREPGEPRNMLDGWCPEGETLYQAIDELGAEAYQQAQDDLVALGTPSEEVRAAAYLQVFTKLTPVLRDHDGRQRAADFELRSSDGTVEVAEVTSSLQEEYERERRRMDRLTALIEAAYTGTGHWLIHLSYGWATPPTTRGLNTLATFVARELEIFDRSRRNNGRLESAPWMWVRKAEGESDRHIEVVSWSSNIPELGNEPYLDRLTRYLASSRLIEKKRRKLRDESDALGASRRHLYLLMAAMGEDGGLLATSPSYLTWGNFAAPPEIADLWLDGGVGEIYRWSFESGWKFHRLRPEWNSDALFGG